MLVVMATAFSASAGSHPSRTHRPWNVHIIIIIIIIMNFYSPVSNTKCHSIGHKMRIARIKIRVDSQGRWEKSLGRESNFEEVCFEPGTEYW